MDARSLDIQRVAFTDPVVQSLVAEVQQEYVARYGGPDETPLEVSAFEPPTGAFFVGFADRGARGLDELDRRKDPVAMGGWRFRPDVQALGGRVAAEIKRMYVVPAARGQGHARAVLATLEASARDAGADVMVLETGIQQPEALALYRSSGYEPVEGFGFYKGSPLVRYLGRAL